MHGIKETLDHLHWEMWMDASKPVKGIHLPFKKTGQKAKR